MENNMYRYAGLCQSFTPGLSVAQAVERQHRFAYIEQRLMRLLASRVVTIPNRDIKALLARLQFEDATHADGWRHRVSEMRTNKSKLEGVPGEALAVLFDEAEYVPGTYPFLVVVTELFKPALIEAYRAYLTITNDLADYPSVRLLRQTIAEEEEHLQLLAAVLQDLAPSPEEQQQADQWKASLQAFLEARDVYFKHQRFRGLIENAFEKLWQEQKTDAARIKGKLRRALLKFGDTLQQAREASGQQRFKRLESRVRGRIADMFKRQAGQYRRIGLLERAQEFYQPGRRSRLCGVNLLRRLREQCAQILLVQPIHFQALDKALFGPAKWRLAFPLLETPGCLL